MSSKNETFVNSLSWSLSDLISRGDIKSIPFESDSLSDFVKLINEYCPTDRLRSTFTVFVHNLEVHSDVPVILEYNGMRFYFAPDFRSNNSPLVYSIFTGGDTYRWEMKFGNIALPTTNLCPINFVEEKREQKMNKIQLKGSIIFVLYSGNLNVHWTNGIFSCMAGVKNGMIGKFIVEDDKQGVLQKLYWNDFCRMRDIYMNMKLTRSGQKDLLRQHYHEKIIELFHQEIKRSGFTV